jgi:hypothetical protein
MRGKANRSGVGGPQEPIPIPDGTDRVVTCDFDCVETILKYTDRHAPRAYPGPAPVRSGMTWRRPVRF